MRGSQHVSGLNSKSGTLVGGAFVSPHLTWSKHTTHTIDPTRSISTFTFNGGSACRPPQFSGHRSIRYRPAAQMLQLYSDFLPTVALLFPVCHSISTGRSNLFALPLYTPYKRNEGFGVGLSSWNVQVPLNAAPRYGSATSFSTAFSATNLGGRLMTHPTLFGVPVP
jgi:hypothetical protein